MAGGTIYQDGEAKIWEQFYTLEVKVNSYRTPNAGCVGYVSVALNTGTNTNGLFHIATLRGAQQIFSGYNNANDLTIEFIQSFFGN